MILIYGRGTRDPASEFRVRMISIYLKCVQIISIYRRISRPDGFNLPASFASGSFQFTDEFRVRMVSIYLQVSRPDHFNLHPSFTPNNFNLPTNFASDFASGWFQFTYKFRVRIISIYLRVSHSIYLRISRPCDFNLPASSRPDAFNLPANFASGL